MFKERNKEEKKNKNKTTFCKKKIKYHCVQVFQA